MSPGDGGYEEPYWYVNLWPYPEKTRLGNLSVGHWHTEGWIGAILTASELLGSSSEETQQQNVEHFVQEATQKCFSLLGGTHPK